MAELTKDKKVSDCVFQRRARTVSARTVNTERFGDRPPQPTLTPFVNVALVTSEAAVIAVVLKMT